MCKVMINFKARTGRNVQYWGYYQAKNTASQFGADRLWADKMPYSTGINCNYRELVRFFQAFSAPDSV
jgi:hypothetical protein